MVRPRLVEEGKPLGDWISSDEENDNEGQEMEMEDHHQPTSSYYRQHAAAASTRMTRPQGAGNNDSSAPASSLLRALGGKLPAPAVTKRPMTFVIGGGGQHSRTAVDDDSMMEHHEIMQHHDVPAQHQDLSWNNNHQHASMYASPSTSGIHPTLHAFAPAQHAPISAAPQKSSSSALHHHHRPYAGVTTRRTHFEIGADVRETERMQGVEDHSTPLPLVVVDGANVAYAYAHARQEHFHTTGRIEPDVRGLSVTCAYFSSMRVRIVLPASFVRAKPRAVDTSKVNAYMETDRFEILQQLQQQGKLVTSPPTDDDDAYCLTIAQRENSRAHKMRQGQAPAFVLSNDLFRDAQERDTSGQLKEWLDSGDRRETGPGRISYTFVDLGTKDDYGDPVFDIVPNPRHPLIAWIENQHKKQSV